MTPNQLTGEVEKEIRKIVHDWYDNRFNEEIFITNLLSLLSRRRQEVVEGILPELHRIWASIPFTQGKMARGMIKKLIKSLEKI